LTVEHDAVGDDDRRIEDRPGVVKKIDGTSRQLKEAILSGARIIITTIQKFGTDHLKEVSGQAGRKFVLRRI
jgi:type I restriction enzyme, R subunit